ncbi:MAG: HAMP domain-containing histidine kinase [Eubacterium sp.]|nr:HAMP domain-containing histidine kinase [Eubacterium sp.]
MDGGRWEKDSSTQPAGYNFCLYFDGEKVSAVKDGRELDLYGDGYYRDSSQWYVPGYQNFTADAAMKNVEVVVFAAKEPVSYTYVKYEEGGYGQTSNRLYDIFQESRQSYDRALRSVCGLAVGAALFAFSMLVPFVRRGKKAADYELASFMGKIWFEAKLAVLLALAAGLLGIAGNADLAYEWNGFDGGTPQTEAQPGDLMDEARDFELLESQSQNWNDMLDDSGFYSEDFSEGEEGFWMEWNEETAALPWLDGFFAVCPLLACFWLCYLLLLDLAQNRKGFFDGVVQNLVQGARAKSLKQPFAVSQVRRVAAGAAAGLLACVMLIVITMLFGIGVFNKVETAAAQCAVLVVFLAVLARCLAGIRRQAQELDLLAEQVYAIQGGDYTGKAGKQGFAEDSSLKPLSESLSKIRQGMEAAVLEQLKSERMKVELVANVSHDLKTPLTSIISYLAFLKQEEGLPEHVQDYIRILDQKAGRLNSIVQDVFAVSQAASGELPVELKRLDYTKLLHQTLADMQEQISKAPVTIKAELPTAPVRIQADGTRLYRVFQNLIQNALQYSLEGSRVFIGLKEESGWAFASVKNISHQELCAGAEFTERFVRGDESRTDGGAGLGLSIAKSFTEACGGTFKLETNADLFAVTVGFAVVSDETF